MISASALRGFVLEELLARLLQSSGFDLLVDESQDRAALTSGINGLRIRGRGANHQVDVLGQLRIRIPFTHPLRLFVEAKYRSSPSGLADVRNALGVLNDVNEHYSVAKSKRDRYVRYQYRYALFSARGFTLDAQQYAITQQISLIDLQAPAFAWLLRAADRVATALLARAMSEHLTTFPLGQVREALRRALGTWTLSEASPPSDLTEAATRAAEAAGTKEEAQRLSTEPLSQIAAQASELDGRLYLGFTSTPFLVVVQPDEPDEAEPFLRSRHRQGASTDLAFAGETLERGEWALTAREGERSLVFRLGLPRGLEPWVLGQDGSRSGVRRRDTSAASTITIAVDGEQAELEFAALPMLEDKGAASSTNLRSNYFRPDLAVRTEDDEGGPARWNAPAVLELLRRLKSEQRPQGAIIEYAAAHNGVVSRENVYEIAGYEPDRMLKGFTRPPRRIARDLVREGLLPHDAQWPLSTRYQSGVQATHFVVPREFSSLLG